MSMKRKVTLVRQTEAADCGLACLSMISNYHGHQIDSGFLKRTYPVSIQGMTLTKMIKVSSDLKLSPRPVKTGIGGVKKLNTPCVLHWGMNHFVVLVKTGNTKAIIYDPAIGERALDYDQMSTYFTGIAVEFNKTPDFAKITGSTNLKLTDMIKNIYGLNRGLAQLFIISFALEVFTLTIPYYSQFVIDNILSSKDRVLLVQLSVLFIIMILIQCTINYMRGLLITSIGSALNWNWTNSLYAKVISLPLNWYEKHNRGDLISRFNSIKAIQATISSSFVGSLLDGLMAITIFGLMLFYNSKLTFVVAGVLVTYVILKAAIYPKITRAIQSNIINQAKQQQELVETFTGAQAIKVNSLHAWRQVRFRTLTSNTAASDITIQRFLFLANALTVFYINLVRVVVVWFSAYDIMNLTYSVGMLLVFLIYSDLFVTRCTGLVDKIFEFKMLNIHFERLADVAIEKGENLEIKEKFFQIENFDIKCENLSFKYADDEPWIVKKVSHTIATGESVALVGPSGCGKSTFAKVLMGLLTPSSGTLTIGGQTIASIGLDNYRDMISAVMQDDKLFSGSIFENICLFDSNATFEQVAEAAKLASVHIEITQLSMGYHSIVGDMGGALSGGQVQRILLARALYRKPRILLLDEATSHLDITLEKKVNSAIGTLPITRIIIAHRPETIASADRIISFL